MKIPPYITKKQIKISKQLFDIVAQTQGLNNALIAKKIILAAMYGTMIIGKITFDDFINSLRNYVIRDGNIKTFWDITYKAKVQQTIFHIKADTLLRGTMKQFELELITLYNDLLNILSSSRPFLTLNDENDCIKKEYLKYYKQMFSK